MNVSNVQSRDLKVNWHPCMQMKDFELIPPLTIQSAQQEWLIDPSGQRYVDATSSWWCKSLGHGHPRLKAALTQQMESFEHVLYANTTYEVIVELSERLVNLMPHFSRVLYASDGSCAVEMAVKMSLQSQAIRGRAQRTGLAALSGGYHGETILAMALSDCPLYTRPFEAVLPEVHIIPNIPYVHDLSEPLALDASQVWAQALETLTPLSDTLACIIFEPIVQGAGGIRFYSPDFLKRLCEWAQTQGIDVIADEIMTGFGRTGRMFASEYAEIKPDFMCLGKGLTAGMLPMSAVLTTPQQYEYFYDTYASGRAFLHSHTHTGNALCAAVALETLKIMEDEQVLKGMGTLSAQLKEGLTHIASETGVLSHLRVLGGVAAAALNLPGERVGFKLGGLARHHGVLLRPLGNTIYWMPPLTISQPGVQALTEGTLNAIHQLMQSHEKIA